MRSCTLLAQRLRSGALAALAFLWPLRLDAALGKAGTKHQIARQERYLACTARVDRDPPCNPIWARYCARECHALYY